MTTQYDGTTPLQPALAALCGTTVKNQSMLAKLTAMAKDALGIDGKRTLPPSDNLAVYEWHDSQIKQIKDQLVCDDATAQKQHRSNTNKWDKALKQGLGLPATDDNTQQTDIETIAPAVPLHDNYSIDIDAIINKPYPSNMAKSAALFNEMERIIEDSYTRGSTATTHIESVETIAPPVAIKTAPTLIEQIVINSIAARNEPPALSRDDAIGLVDYLKAKFPSVTILALKRDANLNLGMVEKLLKGETKNNYEYSDCLKKILELFPDLQPVINKPIETAPAHIEQVETFADDVPVKTITIPLSPTDLTPVEIDARRLGYSDNTVIVDDGYSNNTVSGDDSYSDNATVKIAFRTNTYGENKRQCVTLEGDTINLLMLATGINKRDVPKWVQNAVNEWTAFDDKLPITRQVRRLINRAVEDALIKARA